MKPFTKILVPVDFSAYSAEAVRWAADLSRRYEAALDVVHVFQTMTYALPEGYVVPDGTQLQAIMNEFEAQLAATKRAAVEAGGLKVETKLLQGGVATEILRFAKERECDLIVLGTHGRTGMKHMLLGSVAEYIVRVAPCPVLTVRAPA
jgi:universal stress protein A